MMDVVVELRTMYETQNMRAVGFYQSLSISNDQALLDLEFDKPVPEERDLLVRIEAVAVNPVDAKLRLNAQPTDGEAKVLGYDAVGTVEAVGDGVAWFSPGDTVWYSGVANRPGSNAEYQLVDERLAGRKPQNLTNAEAAALPLTAMTAWELLFDRLGASPSKAGSTQTLLVVGAGGGVGSALVQLAARLTGMTVIATAGRDATADWLARLGAHQVIDHRQPLTAELRRIGYPEVSHVASLTHTGDHFDDIVTALAPQGKIGLIDDPIGVDINKLKHKSASLHWEYLYTRPLNQTEDMIAHHRMLTELAALADAGLLRTTLTEHFGTINAANLKRAHALLESGQSRGKVVLEGF